MKVAFINIDDTLGGASVACLRLAKAIQTCSEVEVTIFTQKKATNNSLVTPIQTGFWWNIKKNSRFILERLYFAFYEKSKEVRFAFSPAVIGIDITEEIENLKEFDVIHLHWINFGFLSLKSLEKLIQLQLPIVWTMHDMWAFTGGCHYSNGCSNFTRSCGFCNEFLKNPSEKDISFEILAKKKLLFSANSHLHFVACSRWLQAEAQKSTLLKEHRISSIPNAIDSSLFFPIEKRVAREKLQLSVNKKFILFAAMKVTDKRKGFSYLQEALFLLNQANDSLQNELIELIIIGNTEDNSFSELPFKVTNLGKISDAVLLNTVYNAADVFVTPSLQDNLPNTIMESLATGTPCVGFNVGGIPEMIDHKENGYVADYLSASSLASGIQWIIEHENYKALSEKSILKVENEYKEQVVTKQYLAVYQTFFKADNS